MATPFLYLRARNKNREIVDLLSMKTTCSMLRADGCSYSYEERPSGGINLVPVRENNVCYPKEDPRELVKEWERYQKALSRLVKRFTGMSVDAKFREDVEQLFYDVLIENYDGIAVVEIEDVKSMILQLVLAYPDEYKNALNRYKNSRKVYLK